MTEDASIVRRGETLLGGGWPQFIMILSPFMGTSWLCSWSGHFPVATTQSANGAAFRCIAAMLCTHVLALLSCRPLRSEGGAWMGHGLCVMLVIFACGVSLISPLAGRVQPR